MKIQSKMLHWKALARSAAIALAIASFALPALAEAEAAPAKRTIELASGEKLEVTVVEETGDMIIADHPIFGRMEIPKDQLAPPAPPRRRDRGLFGTRVLKGWHRRAGMGFAGASGDSNDANLNIALVFRNETDGYRGNFDSAYFFGSVEGIKNKNKFFAGYQHDLLLGKSRFYLFGAARYDFDEFQFWVHRIAGNGGLGYEFVRRDKLSIRGEAGAGFAYEAGQANTTNPEGVVGLVAEWEYFKGQKLRADSTYYPNFSNNPEFRLLTNVAWVIGLGFIDGLSLEVGVKHELNTEADNKINADTGEPFNENNVNYYGNIGYEF
jgi:putative salt-induced outer membrane protein YdiY